MPFSIHHTAVVPTRNVPRLKSGACALLPLAWSTSVSSRHAVLVVLRRRGDYGTLALVNLAGAERSSGAVRSSHLSQVGWERGELMEVNKG